MTIRKPAAIILLFSSAILLLMSGVKIYHEFSDVARNNFNIGVLSLNAGKRPIGLSHLTFHIKNTSRTPIRIVGICPNCTERACLGKDVDEPISIFPGEQVLLTVNLYLSLVGDFHISCQLFYEANELKTARLEAFGVCSTMDKDNE